MPAVSARNARSGFMLIETLVAFSILVLGLVILFQLFGEGFRNIRNSGRDEAALHVAISQITRVGRDIALSPGEQSGFDSSGFQWIITVSPYTPGATSLGSSPLRAYWVHCEVRWRTRNGQSASLSLKTVKLSQG